MGEYTSLIMGFAVLAIVFFSTVAWMNYKAKKISNNRP
jgi:hypothetical protein